MTDSIISAVPITQATVASMRDLISLCHGRAVAAGWWNNLDGTPKERNKGEMIALMHSELSEMLEGVRKNKMDEHLPAFPSETVEAADVLIRLFDYAGKHCRDLPEAFFAKLAYNAERLDHKPAVRAAEGGKQF